MKSVKDQVYGQVMDRVHDQVYGQVYYKVWDQVRVKSGFMAIFQIDIKT